MIGGKLPVPEAFMDYESELISQQQRIEMLRRELEWARAALAKEWQPIDTAPRDGRRVILAGPMLRYPDTMDVGVGAWRWDPTNPKEKTWFVSFEPTHWMPLPLPPLLDER